MRDDFWSRRKASVAAEAEAAATERQAVIESDERAALEARSDEDILAELDLKDPDLLEPGDDFSAFMKAAVPERLRRRALRKLWLSNPALANLDNLVDYGEDFTDAATVVADMQTTYQVGKGMLQHLLAVERAEEAPPTPAIEDIAPPLDEDDMPIGLIADETDAQTGSPMDIAEIPEAPDQTPEPDDPTQTPLRRRMRFEFT